MLEEAAQDLNYVDVDALYTAIGEHHVSPEAVVGRISRLLHSGDPGRGSSCRPRSPGARAARAVAASRSASRAFRRRDDPAVAAAARRCRATRSSGFVTRGRGVSVHRADCANAASTVGGPGRPADRGQWDSDLSGGIFVASIEVRSLDRPGLLGDVSSVLAAHKVNIIACTMKTDRDRMGADEVRLRAGRSVAPRRRARQHPQHRRRVPESYRVLPGASTGG
ncbi:MAG: ACT domain-containing protein [Acidimicrobiales bacterium]